MPHDARISRGHVALLAVTAVMTYLLIVMGGVVCMTGSGLGCPDWPTCYGRILPPPDLAAIIEMTHRFFAVTTLPLIAAAAVLGWRRYRSIGWLHWPPTLAVGLALAVSVFGAFAVLTGLPPVVAAVDVGCALLVLALVAGTWGVAFVRRCRPSLPDRLALRTPLARLACAAAIATFGVLVGGVLVAEIGSVARCVGWPLYGAVAEAGELGGLLSPARRALGVLAAGLIVAVVVQARRRHHDRTPIRPTALALLLALLSEAAVGALILLHGFSLSYGILYTAAASAVWALLVLLTVFAAQAPEATEG